MICNNPHINIYKKLDRYDPTRTTVLRNAFANDMKRRFKELIMIINKSIINEDVFELNKIKTNQLYTPGNEAFSFLRDDEKIKAFMEWLKEQERKGIITTAEFTRIGDSIEKSWTDLYISDSYKRGVLRARYELGKKGVKIPSTEESGGIEFIIGNSPFHIDRVGVLYTRVFSDLVGITNVMDTHISRILSQGMIDGDNPKLIARKLVATINGSGIGDLGIVDSIGRFIPAMQRAEILARTEIIRAYHLATIQEYRNWGIEGVTVVAEWATAGDERVCSKCASMQGQIYTLDQIEKMIPAHPQCRCVALPFIKR